MQCHARRIISGGQATVTADRRKTRPPSISPSATASLSNEAKVRGPQSGRRAWCEAETRQFDWRSRPS